MNELMQNKPFHILQVTFVVHWNIAFIKLMEHFQLGEKNSYILDFSERPVTRKNNEEHNPEFTRRSVKMKSRTNEGVHHGFLNMIGSFSKRNNNAD